MAIITKSGKPLLYEKESYILRGLWMEIYNTLGPGLKESVYVKAFLSLLKKHKISFKHEPILNLYFNGEKVGVYRPDFIVFGKIIVEFKSMSMIPIVDKKKIFEYLKTSKFPLGFIVNFGAPQLQIIRRIYDRNTD